MQMNQIRYVSPKDCPYTFHGINIAEMRRVELRPLARALKVPDGGSANDMRQAIIAQASILQAPAELSELQAAKPKKKAAKKKPAKKQ